MGDQPDQRPRARTDGVIVERLPGETLVYDEASDTAHCLPEAVATIFELCDGTRTRPELAALAAERLGRPFAPDEVDAVVSDLRATELLTGDRAGKGISRRQALMAGGGIAAASLITTIVAPVPAAAQSPAPPGSNPGDPGTPCATVEDCNANLQCQGGECCVPLFGQCSTRADCCGSDQNMRIQCVLIQGSGRVCVDPGA